MQEELKGLRAKRKTITNIVDRDNYDVVTKLEDLKIDLRSDKELLNDIVLLKFTKGETIELEDRKHQAVLPIFSVIMKPEK